MMGEWPRRCVCTLAEQLASEYDIPLDMARSAPDFAYLDDESQRFCSAPLAYADGLRAMAISHLVHPRSVMALDYCFEKLRKRLSSGSHAPHLIAEAIQIAVSDMPMIEEIQGYGAPDQVVSMLHEQLTDAALFTAGRLVKNVAESLRTQLTATLEIEKNHVRPLGEILERDSPTIVGPIALDPDQPVLVVATAGRGTRLRTTIPKALVPLAGRPLLQPILDSASRVGIEQVIIVLKHGASLHPAVLGSDFTYIIQNDALGTGHSFAAGLNIIKNHHAPCILSYSDTPFFSIDCFRKVLEPIYAHRADMTILAVSSHDMPEFGHLEESGGLVRAICQPRFGQQGGGRADGGLYALWPFKAVPALLSTRNHNYRYEYSFTEIVSELDNRGCSVQAVAVDDPREVLGINRPADLVLARRRVCELRAALSFYRRYGGIDGEALSAADLLYIANRYDKEVCAMIGHDLRLSEANLQLGKLAPK